MKKSVFTLFLSLFIFPFLSKAQNPGDLYVQFNTSQCDTFNYLGPATGCNLWISNSSGDTIHQEVLPASLHNWSFYVPYDTLEAPYYVRFDSLCLNSNGVVLDDYTHGIQNVQQGGSTYYADSVQACGSNSSNSINYFVDIYSCDTTLNDPMENAVGCSYWIEDGNGNTIVQSTSLSTPITSNVDSVYSHYYGGVNFEFDSSATPYTLIFDESCFLGQELAMEQSSFVLDGNLTGSSVFDTLNVCVNDTSTTSLIYTSNIYTTSCDSIWESNGSLSLGCDYWVENGNGSTVFHNTIAYNGVDSLIDNFSFLYDSLATPYTLFFDENCLNNNGLSFDNYSFTLDSTTVSPGNEIFGDLLICAYSDTVPNDTCVDLFSFTSPLSGYYQNFDNSIMFEMGNSSNIIQPVHIEIIIPNEAIPVPASFDFSYSVSGSTLSLDTVLGPNSYLTDAIKFNVPWGVQDGTLHEYEINIEATDSASVDCAMWNNQSIISAIVGNSFDPNAKTVNQPEQISSETQEEFIYTIYFQNTGTAPAQDIYILDTLSENLDWTTFEFMRSSHTIGISDLGNGIKKFYFNDIWLPDSTTNLEESNGFLTFKIKEKQNNEVGTEILNTAYIFFDQNEAIITNTTYNKNVKNLGLEDLSSKMEVKLFPNPAEELIYVEAENKIDNLSIYSLEGKLIWSSRPNKSKIEMDVSRFNSGIYFLDIQSKNKTETLRFMKK